MKKELGSSTEIWGTGYTEHSIKDRADYSHHVSYIQQNPVRARLSETAAAYPNCSACGKWTTDPPPPWLKP